MKSCTAPVRGRDLEPGRHRGVTGPSIGDGFPRAEKEALVADAAQIRLDLAPPGSSPTEMRMASRASVSWLEVRLLEFDRAHLLHNQEPNYRKVETLDRMLSRASARLERSLLALVKLKRLKLPMVVATQINVHESPLSKGINR